MTSTPRRRPAGADQQTIVASSPADLLATVPYLLGFHPTDSLVVVGLSGRRVVFAARVDLPPPADAGQVAEYVAAVAAGQGGDAAALVGYGPPDSVDPVMPTFRDAFAAQRLCLVEALRADAGRLWSYLCDDDACCPADGTPYDPSASLIAAAATFAGQAVLPDRAALVRQVAAVDGSARESMAAATVRARERLAALVSQAPVGDVLGGRAVRRAGERAVAHLLDTAGPPLDDDQVAWLTVLLTHATVRDAAWVRTGPQEWHLARWSDVVRRADPPLVATPASLLAFAAWLAGHGALANVALDRALAAQPDHPMACTLRDALDRGVPPGILDEASGSAHPTGRRSRPRHRRRVRR